MWYIFFERSIEMTIVKNSRQMIILFVKDQEKSKSFYSDLLQMEASLDVPGMTEFELTESLLLGIMPEEGIVRILDHKIPHPNEANGIVRNELYLTVDKPEVYYSRLIVAGGTGISELTLRNWGDYVAYGTDLDGHLLAFAKG